jgi:UDP-N-acetylmuramyl pentapeptide phosphotransferase/UDP-N-acetylglucosamine-1-phosphate transferase
MLESSLPTFITISFILGVLIDAYWHVEHEENAMFINIASLFYLVGTIPFVYKFFKGSADRTLKVAMAALYILNIYTFGDPTDTKGVPMFLEKHMANHLGSTLFYYVAVKKDYQTKVPKKVD